MKKNDRNLSLTVKFEDEDKRLDRWLKVKLGLSPQSRVELLCRKGKLLVNGQKVKPSHRVMSGDVIRVPIDLSPRMIRPEKYMVEDLTKNEKDLIRDTLIFEDEYLLAINKPSGIATQGGTGQKIHIDKLASLFSKEAALFCPSGTMTNQIAIRVHTKMGDEVICDRLSHIYNYEGGGIASNSGVSV